MHGHIYIYIILIVDIFFKKNSYTRGWGYGSEGCLTTTLSHEFMLVKVQHRIKSGMVERPTASAQAQWRRGRGVFRLKVTLRCTKPEHKLQCTWDPVSKKKIIWKHTNFRPWLSISLRQFLCFIFVVVLLLLLLFETRFLYVFLTGLAFTKIHPLLP